jgi:geranylgeranylglycerol-phosphate geranylgeranyltransferase
MSILGVGTKQQNRNEQEKETAASFLRSQLVLFQSRKKWGILYSLATVAGLFCVAGMMGAMTIETEMPKLMQKIIPLPLVSLLIATGMYVLNDLVDADLDKANGKKRPIPSGQVSKKQAWSFILWTNLLAVALSIATLNTTSTLLVIPMLVIGILYSAPRIALADRFVIKTISIALFYMLCALLGITSAYGLDLAASNPIVPLHAMFMLGITIFISSVFNDLGDVEGDSAAGRRTIPIVIGRINTVKMAMILACGMAATSWIIYATGGISLITVILTSNFAALVTVRMTKTLKGLDDMEFMRKQHKKMFPLHMVLQSSLVIGTVLL